uniref:Cell division basic protein B-like protein n=1 Tax=Synechococcus elongatus (strain ATCC 33912 / PCC 7942 / FACHB-805) TaxID=1140 RepID=Q8KPR3_SYNE7|nr:unknown [Synechococcus elongatus PCC 7942 = FACHB-805]
MYSSQLTSHQRSTPASFTRSDRPSTDEPYPKSCCGGLGESSLPVRGWGAQSPPRTDASQLQPRLDFPKPFQGCPMPHSSGGEGLL